MRSLATLTFAALATLPFAPMPACGGGAACSPCPPGSRASDPTKFCSACVAIGDGSAPDASAASAFDVDANEDGADGAATDAPSDASADATSDAPADASTGCSFSATYLAYDDGGLRQFVEKTVLAPPRTDTTEEVSGAIDDGSSCSRELTCASASQATVPQIEAAVANADVQAALAMPDSTLYGSDPRPVDGTVWVFKRNGHGFAVGSGPVPAGLTALETLMRQLAADTHASPECGSL